MSLSGQAEAWLHPSGGSPNIIWRERRCRVWRSRRIRLFWMELRLSSLLRSRDLAEVNNLMPSILILRARNGYQHMSWRTHQPVFDKPRVRPVACPLKRETYSLAGPIPRCCLVCRILQSASVLKCLRPRLERYPLLSVAPYCFSF